ncbi:MAG: hypothetical protein JWM43_4159 [Acidobacteriaceae bacterium]|nr:hypothetical protein [Acidobacteriaceae bacterium]
MRSKASSAPGGQVTASSGKVPACLERNSDFAVENLSDNGEDMEYDKASPATADSWLEMEQRLASLRTLVCDLLKANQELRQALLSARLEKTCNERIGS